MLTRKLAEDLIRRFSNECKIENEKLNIGNGYLIIDIDKIPMSAGDDFEYNHFREILESYYTSSLESIIYLYNLPDDIICYGEEPTMCWKWGGQLFPITEEEVYDIGEDKDVDFITLYKHLTGMDWNGTETLYPTYCPTYPIL